MAHEVARHETDDVHGEISEASAAMELEAVDEDTTPLSPFETLTEDCLMELFSRSEIIDLIKMFDINRRCRSVIQDNRFSTNKLFDLPVLRKVASLEWIFKIFGKHMTKLRITTDDIIVQNPTNPYLIRLSQINFLSLLKRYGAEGKITELNISSGFGVLEFTPYAESYLKEANGFFRNVASLKISSFSSQFFDLFPLENLLLL